MGRLGSLLLLPLLLTALAGCEKPASPPPPAPVKKVEPPPKPVEPPKAPEAQKAPEPPKEVMVKLEGKLATKVKAAKYELYLSKKPCAPTAATGQDRVGGLVPVAADLKYRVEVAVPSGTPVHLCALGLDKSNRVIGAGSLPDPFTFTGFGSIPSGLNVLPAKGGVEPTIATPPSTGAPPPKKAIHKPKHE